MFILCTFMPSLRLIGSFRCYMILRFRGSYSFIATLTFSLHAIWTVSKLAAIWIRDAWMDSAHEWNPFVLPLRAWVHSSFSSAPRTTHSRGLALQGRGRSPLSGSGVISFAFSDFYDAAICGDRKKSLNFYFTTESHLKLNSLKFSKSIKYVNK